ncbi:MAG: hypothetical protein AB7T37_05640 [Dehalococcoidia bacterium]
MKQFHDFDARVKRAIEHLDELTKEAGEFLAAPVLRPIQDFDTEPGFLLVKVKPPGPVPIRLSVLVGEILYQFRAALNNLACELTELNGQPATLHTAFPIFSDRDQFAKWRHKRIGDMSQIHQGWIESEQPFIRYSEDPSHDPLCTLYGLSDLDRHRALHLTYLTARSEITSIWPDEVSLTLVDASLERPFDDETIVARYRVNSAKPGWQRVLADTTVQLDLAFERELGVPFGGQRVFLTVGRIGERIGDMVKRLVAIDQTVA